MPGPCPPTPLTLEVGCPIFASFRFDLLRCTSFCFVSLRFASFKFFLFRLESNLRWF